MNSSSSIQYDLVPTDESSPPEETLPQARIHSLNIDSSQVMNATDDEAEEPEDEEKETEVLIQALVRGENRTYLEKINLALRSSFLTLPPLFVNASFIFLDTQRKLETTMLNNVYYNRYFHKLIQTLSYEGSIVSAEASSITSASVILTVLITASTIVYQARCYQRNKQKMKNLVNLLEEKNYVKTRKLLSYPLSDTQLAQIQALIHTNALDEQTVIAADPSSRLEKGIADLLWFHKETNKYITPLLPFSLIPGFFFMYQVAQDLEEDMNCSVFPLWSLLFEGVCPTLQKVELLSLLTYLWGCFSGAYLLSHSLVLTARLALSPFPSFRLWFQEKINQPFAAWYGENQDYEKLLQKSLMFSVLPLAGSYSLYRSIQFVNTYLAGTGCVSLSHALTKPFFPGNSYPCSSAQAALGISVFLGELEFDHLYPAYMAIEMLSLLSAQLVKRLAYFKQESTLAKVKNTLAQFSIFENKMMLALSIGAIIGGVVGFLPSYNMGNMILRKEGFELFFPLNNLTMGTNLSLPDIGSQLPFDLDTLINHVPACTLSSTIGIPDFPLGNDTFPGFNATIPCVETFFDPASNSTILGLQITPPCPSESIDSAFYRNLLHLPLSCDPVILVRAFAGLAVPFWLSVNSGAAVSMMLAAATLFTVWAVQNGRPFMPRSVPAPSEAPSDMRRRNDSHRLFSNKKEKKVININLSPRPSRAVSPGEEKDLNSNLDYWTRFKRRISQFFHPQQPRPQQPTDLRSHRSLLRGTPKAGAQ